MHPALEGDAIGLNVPFQIVTADVKRKSRRHAEQPLKGLRFHLDILKLALGHRIAAVRAVPVAKIYLFATRLAGDTPVRDLVQGAGKKSVRKHDTVIGRFIVSRKVDRLIVAFNQAGIKFFGKAAVEKVYQLLIMVLLLH